MHAVRNISLCTKDCLCLYVCPTGATDTETGQIDAETCISGCRLCVDACPSHAISLVPEEFPKQQSKSDDVKQALKILSESKTKQETLAFALEQFSKDPMVKQISKAIGMSNRIIAEDLLREAGFMLPQSDDIKEFLVKLSTESKENDFPKETVKKLLQLLNTNNNSKK